MTPAKPVPKSDPPQAPHSSSRRTYGLIFRRKQGDVWRMEPTDKPSSFKAVADVADVADVAGEIAGRQALREPIRHLCSWPIPPPDAPAQKNRPTQDAAGMTVKECSASNATGARRRAVAARRRGLAPSFPGACQGSAPTP